MYLDADVLYALLKRDDFQKPYALNILQKKDRKYTSTVTLLELEIVVKRELGDAMSLGLSDWLKRRIPDLRIVPFSRPDFEKSLTLREKYGLGIFDAAHAASCLNDDGVMASTDHVYDRIPGLARVKE
ncbi:MAG TPA: PIN domain-containing protein [Candidatus Norongarragalinales archaeon]|nr:PIN domain-containing protein [Candidatus Norongarragalinales archaeon]